MSKLVPNKKTYVKRLKAMLERKEPCSLCPKTPHFMSLAHHWGGPLPHSIEPYCDVLVNYCNTIRFDTICEMCREFVGLRPVPLKKKKRCPCEALGKQQAITRALQAIEAYEAGTHKWCKEKP